jgi:ABC-type multidrug transport system fused ATPase/permease subunit
MVDPLLSLSDMLALMDLDAYVSMPRGRETFAKLKRLRERAAAEDNESLLQASGPLEQIEIVRVFAVASLSARRVTPEQVQRLRRPLLEDESISVRLATARLLRAVPVPETIPLLLKALLNSHDPQLRAVLAYALQDTVAPVDWQVKVSLLLDMLQADGRYHEHLEMGTLVTAVMPQDNILRQNRFILADYFTALACLHDEARIIGILAGLLLESCGRNLNRANERVDNYIQTNPESKKKLQTLRTEINSSLTPAELQNNLRNTFQKPLAKVHDEIHSSWKATIKDAARILKTQWAINSLISVASFLILGVAIYLMLGQQEWLTGLIAAAIALVILVISLRFGGAGKEIREVLAEIGIANAAYAAYVQRLLEISHVYARLYLDEKPSYKHVHESNKLINAAVQDTIKALRVESPPTLEAFLDQIP